MLNAGILEYLLNGGAVLVDSQGWSERSERNPWFGHGLGLKSRGATALLGTTANAIALRLLELMRITDQGFAPLAFKFHRSAIIRNYKNGVTKRNKTTHSKIHVNAKFLTALSQIFNSSNSCFLSDFNKLQ